uniref:Uncharacterized protein n=1 Tax=Schistocephalus solidus TaxID=70667 RepID=A0A0X3NGZ3_SCHSO
MHPTLQPLVCQNYATVCLSHAVGLACYAVGLTTRVHAITVLLSRSLLAAMASARVAVTAAAAGLNRCSIVPGSSNSLPEAPIASTGVIGEYVGSRTVFVLRALQPSDPDPGGCMRAWSGNSRTVIT